MKTRFMLFAVVAAFCFSFTLGDKKAKPVISLTGKSSVATKPTNLATPYIALKFRTGSMSTVQAGKGQNASRASAYAVLNGIDDKLFQEITDEFYVIFQNKMKEVGLTSKSHDEIKANEYYQKWAEDTLERHFNNKSYGTSDVFTPNNVPFFSYPTIMIKPMKFAEKMDANLTNIRLQVDFAEFDMDAARSYGYYETTTSFNANIIPGIKITAVFQEGAMNQAFAGSYLNWPGFTMTNGKGQACTFALNQPIFVKLQNADVKAYDSKTPEFAKGFRFFGGAVQLGTWVVKPTREDYKRAALEALTKYVDEAINAIKEESK